MTSLLVYIYICDRICEKRPLRGNGYETKLAWNCQFTQLQIIASLEDTMYPYLPAKFETCTAFLRLKQRPNSFTVLVSLAVYRVDRKSGCMDDGWHHGPQVFLLHYLIYAYIAWSMHTSRDLCIHRVIYAYIAWSMHTSDDLCIHRVIYAYIAWSMHTSRDLCIHRVIYAYIAWSMHTSHDLCIHRMIYAYITWSMLTSRDLCIRRMIYAYIAWSMVHNLLYITWSMHTSSDLWIHRVIYDTSTFNWIFVQTAPHSKCLNGVFSTRHFS